MEQKNTEYSNDQNKDSIFNFNPQQDIPLSRRVRNIIESFVIIGCVIAFIGFIATKLFPIIFSIDFFNLAPVCFCIFCLIRSIVIGSVSLFIDSIVLFLCVLLFIFFINI